MTRVVAVRAKVVDGGRVRAGAFAGKNPPARFFKPSGAPESSAPRRRAVSCSANSGGGPPAETIQMEEGGVPGYSGRALHPCDGLLRGMASVARERSDHFGIPRPTVRILPGG